MILALKSDENPDRKLKYRCEQSLIVSDYLDVLVFWAHVLIRYNSLDTHKNAIIRGSVNIKNSLVDDFQFVDNFCKDFCKIFNFLTL